jgi:putative ABC transport system permease protein
LIYHQLDFLLHKDLGFDAEQILVLNTTTATPQQRSVLKKELLKEKVILEVTMTSAPPSVPPNSFGLIPPENAGDEERRILFYHTYVDADFAKAMGLSIQEGRFFDTENPGDSSPYIIVNTAGALAFGDSLLNRSFDIPRFTKPGNNKRSVLGTLADYHFASLHSLVQPLVLELNPEQCRYLLVRCEPKQIQHALSAVGSVWRETLPQIPLDYTFMTDAMAKYYLDEQRQKTVMSGIAIISILLASLGIFGSTLFLVQRRTKEVAIRKTLGSTRQDLLLMLGKPILLLLISSSLLGIPLVLYSGDAWLQQYPYRVGIDPFLFGTSFLVMLAVVLATILHHFLKVTRVNPSQILKQTD